MSTIDLFASAMGAFLLIALIALPYYLKKSPQCPDCQVCPTPVPEQTCPVCPTIEPAQTCPPQASPMVMDKLLMIDMAWHPAPDVDLHLFTPDGHFYYDNKSIDGRPGFLYQDFQQGPAKEIWLATDPTPGEYEVCYHWFAGGHGAPIKVVGNVYKPSGTLVMPEVRLPSRGACLCPIRFVLGADYQFEERSRSVHARQCVD